MTAGPAVTTVALGALLALLLVAVLRRRPPARERRGYAVGLVVATAVYLALSLRWLDRPSWILVEASGLALFSLTAWLGVSRSAWWLAGGWAAHVGWDLLLHGGGDPGFVPRWYPLLCAGFDPVIAAAAVRRRG